MTTSNKPNFGKSKSTTNLRELFMNDQPIWVVNMTGTPESTIKVPGNVIMQIGRAPNHDKITVMPGADPWCLSDMTDYESLKECRDLFKLVNSPKKILKVLDPAKAEEYYAINADRREAVEEKIKRLTSEAELSGVDDDDKVQVEDIKINNRIIATCLSMKHDKLTQEEALETLIEYAGMYNVNDYSYLLSNGKFKSVKQWARQQLQLLESGNDEDDPIEASTK